jgi:hypothetical protein
MLKTSLIALTVAALSLAALPGCASDDGDWDVDGEGEHEPAPGAVADALVSAVDCTPRRETAYVSGRASSIDVITIGGKAVTRATGHAFLRMQRAAHNAGVYLALTSGFRTNREQQYLYGCYRSGNCNNGNLAARPGYSNHQSGIAVDLTTSAWLAANAGKFGFRRTVPSEPWHYEYFGADPGGPCNGGIAWESPRDGGWYKNGIWFKATAPKAAKMVYDAGPYRLGESTDAAQSFPVRYSFNQLGHRTVTATAYDAAGKLLGSSVTSFRVTP